MNDQTSTDELAVPLTGPGGRVTSSDQEPDGTEVWAVCCSGGGIRSASYYLGALQALEEGGFLKKTKPILGAPGSPEEQHLRDNTRYIAPDAKTLLAGMLSLLFGVAVTLVLVLTPVFAVAHVRGWVLRSRRVTFVIFLWWWVTLRPGPHGQERQSQVAVKALGWAAFITVVLALRTVLDDLGFGSGAGWTPAAIGGFVAAVVAVSQSARNTLTKYDLLKRPEAAQGSAPQPGLIGTAVGYLRGLLLPWLASAYSVIRNITRRGGKPSPFGIIDLPGALLSELSGQQPKLVLCTTANINSHRKVPPGRAGLSFSFDPDQATLRGPGPAEAVQARTTDYEALVGPHWFTLFDVSAISGAAFSPLMGAGPSRGRRAHQLPGHVDVRHRRAEFDAYRELGACSVTLARQGKQAGRRVGNAVAGGVGNEMRRRSSHEFTR